jgi:diadenosine tetraphosphate (Ap4A) HIT family hydrolase
MAKLMTRKEYDTWYKTIPENACTFCDWQKYQIVLKEFEHWVWIANIAPYWKWHTMIIPKRHFEKYSDMTFMEAGELVSVIDYGEKKLLSSNLLRSDGSKVEKVVYFWRFRFNRFDEKSGTIRPAHFHIHLCPDKDHLWDPIIDEDAHLIDLEKLK